MKVYVDELPKSCKRCPFHDTKYGICDISGSRVEYFGCHSLTPLSDYTKQVKKEVCEEIRKFINSKSNPTPNKYGWHDSIRQGRTLNEILDQIQGE